MPFWFRRCLRAERDGPGIPIAETIPKLWGCFSLQISVNRGERSLLGQMMAKGTVKWFNPTKGYGFIQPQGGGKDVFVHVSAVERAGLNSLNEGQVVEFEEVSSKGKTSAENLKVQR